MSFFKSKKDLDDERRERQAKEAEEALGKIEIPILMDHNYDDLVAADAADAARAAARETKRAAERAAERAYAAEIAAEIPEAQKAIQLLTEYWKNMNEYKARHMNADGRLIDYSIHRRIAQIKTGRKCMTPVKLLQPHININMSIHKIWKRKNGNYLQKSIININHMQPMCICR